MANREQLELLKQGVEVWNRWREEHPDVDVDLRKANFSNADLSRANLIEVNLSRAFLYGTNLRGADLSRANLSRADLIEANLTEADLSRACLSGADLSGANLFKADLREADLREADLSGSDFREADLREADLCEANCGGARFSRADLCEAKLISTLLIASELLGSNLTAANLTGACIQDCNINNATQLDGVVCEYIYLKFGEWSKQEEGYLLSDRRLSDRRPSDPNRIFASGEFQTFIQKAISTVDLIFASGIDWQIFFQSFVTLRSQYDERLSIQAIEKKSGSALVIRLEVPAEADKAAIERQAKEIYEMKLQLQEERYRVELNAKDREIELYKRQNARMDRIVELLGTKKVSLHPNQIKILRAIQDGNCSSNVVANVVNLSISTVKYYLEEMSNDGYLRYDRSLVVDSIRLTDKGYVALDDPNLLLPQHRESNGPIHQTTIHAPNSQFGVINSGSGNVSNFSQNIGNNIDDITKLINSLRDTAKTFPEEQREDAEMELDDLEGYINDPEKRQPQRLKKRLIALFTLATALTGIVTGSADFANNVLELSDKLNIPIPIELIQAHQAKQPLPPGK